MIDRISQSIRPDFAAQPLFSPIDSPCLAPAVPVNQLNHPVKRGRNRRESAIAPILHHRGQTPRRIPKPCRLAAARAEMDLGGLRR
jgi:hypothetical protein